MSNEDAESEEITWILDSVVGFLKGPVWNIPVLTFIEQQSVVFEPDALEDEQVENEYKKLFEEYKSVVDALLGNHMHDLGINPEQFEFACTKASGLLTAKFHQSLFEQIWAANDYEIFKRMMIQRNIDLQLQALEILAQRYGLVFESFIPEGGSKQDFLQDDDTIMEKVLKLSLEEHEKEKEEMANENEKMENIINLESTLEEKGRLEEAKEREQKMMDRAMHEALNISGSGSMDTKPLKIETSDVSVPKSGINPAEIKTRQDYLRKQRDKLIELKKQEREKQILKLEESEILSNRPKSGKALRSLLEDQEESDGDDQDKGLAFRRSLAARLKAEVIEGHKTEENN